ncbi:agmatine deiminase family protein [Amnibacterium setariae]|uniref:Agmatine deiminase family protein n=1 Tax=Amnibacterium setariae TaxID=2306585 RepID=A0A3A1U259_9MICO|nr:agmatine deiminase family protein [Amnibacterium setariae]RIX27917.1 agmatine deiminase family protein [Amnibacterium setariae]
MPAETAAQERIWMAFPRPNATFGTGEAESAAWAAVANAVAAFEPVTMLVDPVARAAAERLLDGAIELRETPLDDAWLRDSGPTFVLDEAGALGAVDWTFNGWGDHDWSEWGRDRFVGATVGEAASAEVLPSLLVNEGGGIHVDGEGTVLLTETVQLDPRRNPYADRARVEAELARTIGATHAVWLPRGLTRDYERYGTTGHVDICATIPSPGRVLLHDQRDPGHPDHAVSALLREVLEQAVDAAGRSFEIVPLPAPETLRDDEGFVDWSYVNHVVVNDGVIACGFGEERADAVARDVLAEAYPGRRVVTVDARAIFACGGGIHCITQQQPASRA